MHPRKSSNNLSRRVICGLLALITVCSLCFLPGLIPHVHAAKAVTIPDPSDYFGKLTKESAYTSHSEYYYENSAYSKLPESKIEDYIDALEDCGLKLTKRSQTEYKGSITGKRYEVKSSNEDAVHIYWEKSNKQVRIQVFSGFAVKNSKDTKAPTVPNPGDYFNGVDETTKTNTSTGFFCTGFSTYPKNKVESYIKELKELGLTGGTVKNDGNDKVAVMQWNGNDEVWIRWDKAKKRMFINISEPLTVAKAGTTPTKPTNDKPSIVEMINDIFGKSSEIKEYDDSTRYFYYVSSYPSSKMTKFAKELKELGIKEVVKYEHSDGGKCIEYHWKDEVLAKVWLYAKKNKNDEFSIAVYWAVLKESGKFDTSDIPDEPTPPTPTGGSGSSACMNCSGGACRNCGGKGYTRERLAGKPGQYTTKTCTTCYGTKKCRTCGGSGWVD